MSETRVNMRKIVGLADDLANLAPQGHRPRIGMGVGVAYAAGYHAGNDGGLGSADGSGELGERDADGGRGDDAPAPREADGGLHDAGEALPPTGEVPGLGGLYDCGSGRCVNVRFDGVVPPPEGWKDACTPPRPENMPCFKVTRPGSGYPIVFDYFPSVHAACAAYESRFDGRIKKVNNHWLCGISNSQGFKGFSGVQVNECYPDEHQYLPPATWPAAQCSEVAYDAQSGRFKDGACGNDPLLPQHLQGQYSGFELCDKDGNKVRVKRTRYGIEVAQEAHGRVTTLDADTFKVINQSIR